MLKVVTKSSNKKIGNCSATYRSGSLDIYGTCPQSCQLMPAERCGSTEIDQEYLQALVDAVPDDGVSWTYSHFPYSSLPLPTPGTTCINFSADTTTDAVLSFCSGYPTVVVTPANRVDKVETHSGVRFVRCPAEYLDNVQCSNCGGDTPLCARADRDYVIKFTAHGTSSKKVCTEQAGGCYGSTGPITIQWANTMRSQQPLSDAETLTAWIKTLPSGTKVRHHVVGDIG